MNDDELQEYLSGRQPIGNRWFGQPWPRAGFRAPVCDDDRLRIAVPVGMDCALCGETFVETDQGVCLGPLVMVDGLGPVQNVHKECQLRNVLGCSANLFGRGHDHTGNYREDARLVERWVEQGGLLDY